MQNGRFRQKLHFAWRKSATKFLCVKTISDKVIGAFIRLTIRSKMIGGDDPFYLKFWVKLTALEPNRRFSIYFARSASAVTHSKKSSINSDRKSTTHFLMNARWTSYVVPISLPKGVQKREVSKSWTIKVITPKRHQLGCQLLLITNKKSHTGFLLIPTSMTLNGVIALI